MRFLLISVLCTATGISILGEEGRGKNLGPVHLEAEAGVRAAHDNRAISQNSGYEEDFYGEAFAGLTLENQPAMFQLGAGAEYGYRYYSEFSEINDDFYTLDALLLLTDSALKLGVSGEFKKSLNYGTEFEPDTGRGPDSVLTDLPNTRFLAEGNLGYDYPVSDKFSIMPEYKAEYYNQRLSGGGNTEIADWVIQKALAEARYRYSVKTMFSAGLEYSLQENKVEKGRIATAYAGAQSDMSDKTSFNLRLGLSSADYEDSGAGTGAVSDFKVLWRAAESLSIYGFGGNEYQPGYGGGDARMLYRLGYGFAWQLLSRWKLSGRGLHSYEDGVDGDTVDSVFSTDDLMHFYNASLGCRITNRLFGELNFSYTIDGVEPDRIVTALGLSYLY